VTTGSSAPPILASFPGSLRWPLAVSPTQSATAVILVATRTTVVRDGDIIVGWLFAESDDEVGRTWWWGPFVDDNQDWDAVADVLWVGAKGRLGRVIHSEQELAGDSRSQLLAAFASRQGYYEEEGSACLVLAPDNPDGQGAGILANTANARISVTAAEPGYRGIGVGRALVSKACRRGFANTATHAHLTVRASNTEARALYRSLGFETERILVPYRRGFSLTAT
jgi:ribosomal protein S18 acetylase RimI-like enzyme